MALFGSFPPPGGVHVTTKIRQHNEAQQENPPFFYTMRSRRSDVTLEEKHYARSLTTDNSGFCRRDDVAPDANSIYRCPIALCAKPHGRGGVPSTAMAFPGR